MVRAVCLSHIFESDARPDLIQESFVDGYAKLPELRDPNRFAPWLAAIVRNKCRQWIRSKKREERAKATIQLRPPPSPDPFQAIARSELLAWLTDEIVRLPAKTREAMCLCYVEGFSISNAAAALGVSISVVKQRLYHGRKVVGAKFFERIQEKHIEQRTIGDEVRQVMAAIPVTEFAVPKRLPWPTAIPIVLLLMAAAAFVIADLITKPPSTGLGSITLALADGNAHASLRHRVCIAPVPVNAQAFRTFLGRYGVAPKTMDAIYGQTFDYVDWMRGETPAGPAGHALQDLDADFRLQDSEFAAQTFGEFFTVPAQDEWTFWETDEDGNVTISDLSPGTYFVEVLTWPSIPLSAAFPPWHGSNRFFILAESAKDKRLVVSYPDSNDS